MHAVIDFLFPTGRQPLKMDLFRWVFWFSVLLLVLGWQMNDLGLALVLGAAFLVRTLIEHLWWRSHPPKEQPVTRYTNPRYHREH